MKVNFSAKAYENPIMHYKVMAKTYNFKLLAFGY